MHRVILLMSALAACKSPGTFTLDFDLDGSGPCAAFGSGSGSETIDHYVLYAERDSDCFACECGMCAGIHRSVLVCPSPDGTDCTRDSLAGKSIPLDPGIWAVVLEAYSGGSGATLLANECIDVVVDQDGQSTETLGLGSGSGSDTGSCQACD